MPRTLWAATLLGIGAAFTGFRVRQHAMAFEALKAKNASIDLTGKTALVVGGTAGLGHGIAVRLAQANASVTIVGRNAEAAEKVLAELRAKGRKEAEFRFVPVDASLLSNVKAFSERYKEEAEASGRKDLDYLVLTQGIATLGGRQETIEGLDKKMAIHYYGRMAFIASLLPMLRASAAAGHAPQVLSVLSAGAHSPYQHYREDPDCRRHYTQVASGYACGLYNDVALDALSRSDKNKGISFIHAAPGLVNTDLNRDLPWILQKIAGGLGSLMGMSIYDASEYLCAPLLRPGDMPDASATAAGGAGSAGKDKGKFLLLSAPWPWQKAGADAAPVPKTKVHEDALEPVFKHTKEVLSKAGVDL